jgi:copper transport protein
MRRAVAIGVLGLGAFAADRYAAAHAVPVMTIPAASAVVAEAPREVVIRFSERVDPRASTLEVLDARGQRVDRGDAVVDLRDPWRYQVSLPPLAPGPYTVSWRVLSADDGHVTDGAHVFDVGGTGAAASAPARVTPRGAGLRPFPRWLVAAGGALLLGVGVVRSRLALGAAPPGVGAPLELLGGAAVLVGGTADLVLQARDLAGARQLAGVLATLLTTPSGHVWLGRGVLLLLLAGLWWRERHGAAPGLWRRVMGVGLASAVVVSGGLVSHSAATIEGRGVALGAEALHLLATALWTGGLLGFATVFWRAPAATPGDAGTQRLVLAIPAFSGHAVLAVGILAVSGLVLARLHLTAWSELVSTAYGRWLAAKLAVFAAMLALGGYHQRRVHRRLRHAVERGASDPGTVRRFRRSLRTEAALGLVALFLAAALGATPPPGPLAAEAGPGFRHERAFDEARVRLEVIPLRPGPNTIRLTVTDPAGRPLADAMAAMVQLVPAGGGVGPVTFSLAQTAAGVFATPEAVLGIVGRWDGRLVVQRAGAYDVNDRFELVLAEWAPAHQHGTTPGLARRARPWDGITASVALVATALTLGLFLRSRREWAACRRLLTDTPQPPASAPARR